MSLCPMCRGPLDEKTEYLICTDCAEVVMASADEDCIFPSDVGQA